MTAEKDFGEFVRQMYELEILPKIYRLKGLRLDRDIERTKRELAELEEPEPTILQKVMKDQEEAYREEMKGRFREFWRTFGTQAGSQFQYPPGLGAGGTGSAPQVASNPATADVILDQYRGLGWETKLHLLDYAIMALGTRIPVVLKAYYVKPIAASDKSNPTGRDIPFSMTLVFDSDKKAEIKSAATLASQKFGFPITGKPRTYKPKEASQESSRK